VLDRFKPFLVPVILIIVAAALYQSKIQREMVDFGVYRTAGARARAAEPLYRAEDGHYQFKYLPAFAIAMEPFASIDPDVAKTIWFAMSIGLLTAYVRWAVRALPERRRSERTLIFLTVVLMAKFYGHELTLGQTNVLLGTLLVAALLAAQVDQPYLAGALIGVAAFVKPYALVLLPWLAVTYGMATVGISLLVVAVGLLVPAFIYGWAGNLELLAAWVKTVSDSTAPNLLVSDNISIAAMWAKWIGPGSLATGCAALTIVGALALAIAAWWAKWIGPGQAASALAIGSTVAAFGLVAAVWNRRRGIDAPEYLEFALLMLFVPLLSPQGWDYVLLLATPAVVCLVDRWREMHIGWRVSVGVALALMCLTIFDVMGRDLYGRFMMWSIVSVAALALAAALANLRWKAMA
jgi:hypothetical protein